MNVLSTVLIANALLLAVARAVAAQVVLEHGEWVRAASNNGVIYMGRVAATGFGLRTSDSLRVSLAQGGRGALVLSRPDTVLSVATAELVRIERGADRGYGWVRRWAMVGAAAGAGAGALVGFTTPAVNSAQERFASISLMSFAGFLTGLSSGQMSRVKWQIVWRTGSPEGVPSNREPR